jgi:hypothetical protein
LCQALFQYISRIVQKICDMVIYFKFVLYCKGMLLLAKLARQEYSRALRLVVLARFCLNFYSTIPTILKLL